MKPRDRRGLGDYQRCACGKVLAADRATAKRLRREIAARTGHSNECRYYTCSYGSHHWTEDLDQPLFINRKAS